MMSAKNTWLWSALVLVLAVVLFLGMLAPLQDTLLQVVAVALVIAAVVLVFVLRPGTPPGEDEVSGPRPVVRHFHEEGVTVIIPWQGRAVDIEKLPPGSIGDQPGDQDDFKPKRLVIDWRVYDRHTGETVYEFDPPLKFQVAYTPDDVSKAGGLERLRLASVVHKEKRWQVFNGQGHGFKLIRDSAKPNTGIGYVDRVSMWDDRHTGWGGM